MRENFPFFKRRPDIVYLDSAATSQTYYSVADDQRDFMLEFKSNAHRSGHSMGTLIDLEYSKSKIRIGEWLGIKDPCDRVVFNSGTSQGLYDAVQLINNAMIGGNIYLGIDSHHSLTLPFRQLALDAGRWNIIDINLDPTGLLDLDALEQQIKQDSAGCKIIAVSAVSNVLGKVNDLDRIKKIAHTYACTTVIDAAQIISKRNIDYNGFDFVAWSWHKIYGPTGLGTLLIDPIWKLYPPVHPGGGSVLNVSNTGATWTQDASRFESGTQNLAAIYTLPKLIDWLMANQTEIESHDRTMASFVNDHVSSEQFIATSQCDSGLISLIPKFGQVEDYAMMLDASNIMVRSGKLCAQPLLTALGTTGMLRISWACYTTYSEIETVFDKLGGIYARLSRHV
jgi:selenocysteine lyase/cysteine desulfurase